MPLVMSCMLPFRLILSLEEKSMDLRMLEQRNLALNNQLSQFHSALQQAELVSSSRAGQLQQLNTQIQALQDAVTEKAAQQDTREKELLQELEKSRAGEQSLRDAVHVLQVEMSELRLRLQSSEERAEAMATHCEAMEMELRMAQADNNQIKACKQELQTLLEETQQAIWRAEQQKTSLETALKEEAVTVRQEVASLQRKLESQEKERQDVLHERELYEGKMRDLEKKIEVHGPTMRNHKGSTQQLEVEREGMQEDLERGAAALEKWIQNTQVLSDSPRKSEIAKGSLKKHVDILTGKRKSEIAKGSLKKHVDILTGKTCIQVGTGSDLQSTPMTMKDSSDISHKEVGLYIP
ncbi:centrosome-associated protein CEP250-like, partial [Cyanistes caeruleus]|uniref:centrosome-associated protein CEP250-like n=1 Tax=Cyanistes caeruleus TaxID=156563 RepID=UPI000CDADDAE